MKTEMQKEVTKWLRDCYDKEDRKSAYQDLRQYGCVSGMVNGMIYYTDTLDFFERHQDEINDMIKEWMDSVGGEGPFIAGFKGYDDDDPLCLYEINRNLIAWFAFETVAYDLFEEKYGD